MLWPSTPPIVPGRGWLRFAVRDGFVYAIGKWAAAWGNDVDEAMDLETLISGCYVSLADPSTVALAATKLASGTGGMFVRDPLSGTVRPRGHTE